MARDGEDRCGAGLRLARLGARAAPAAPPAAHVRELFDGYAARFEDALVGRLGYRAPERLCAAIDAVAGGRRFRAGLDLGCGTGLMARALAGRVAVLDGVDLSPAMIEVARASGLYHALCADDLVAELDRRADGSLDLVTAADVFCYLGDLTPAFAAVARVSAAGAVFAFSVEKGADTDGFVLRDSLRYAHGRDFVVATAEAAGFDVATLEETGLRRDRDAEIVGLVVVLVRRSA